MGQRTQIVIEVTVDGEKWLPDCTKVKDPKTYVASYHNQWGFAKKQLFDVVRFLTENHRKESVDKNKFVFPKDLQDAFLIDDDFKYRGKATPEKVMDYLNRMDNNNGGLFLKINMDEHYRVESGKLYIFNDPESECSQALDENKPTPEGGYRVNRAVSLMEYVSFNQRYFDIDFLTMFTAMLRFYNIEIVEYNNEKKL